MGSLEVITGCMFAGKTEELIRRINRERYVHPEESIHLFKPKLDNRYGEEPNIISHNKTAVACQMVSSVTEIQAHLTAQTISPRVVGIDEIHFFDDRIIRLCLELVYKHDAKVIASGLNTDFRGEPFIFRKAIKPFTIGDLMAYAQKVDMLSAICNYQENGVKCTKEAHFTQRLFPDGKPVPYEDELFVVGSHEVRAERKYEARCLEHHLVPGRLW